MPEINLIFAQSWITLQKKGKKNSLRLLDKVPSTSETFDFNLQFIEFRMTKNVQNDVDGFMTVYQF